MATVRAPIKTLMKITNRKSEKRDLTLDVPRASALALGVLKNLIW